MKDSVGFLKKYKKILKYEEYTIRYQLSNILTKSLSNFLYNVRTFLAFIFNAFTSEIPGVSLK